MSTQIVPQGQDTGNPADLYMSFELSDKKWQLTLMAAVARADTALTPATPLQLCSASTRQRNAAS